MLTVKIAGLTAQINSDAPLDAPELGIYTCDAPSGPPDTTITFIPTKELPLSEAIYRDLTLVWGYVPDGRICCDFLRDNQRALSVVADADWREVEIYHLPWFNQWFYLFRPALEIAFRNMALSHGVLMIHSSAISVGGRGLAFSASSGTGKTTHAKLWVEHREAVVINGDRPFYKVEGKRPYVCGSLWCGSSAAFTADIIPLDALIFIERANQNRIRPLSPVEALPYLLPRCFLPYFSESRMALAMGIVDRLIETTDCYHLRCLPNLGALEVVEKCVMTNRRF